MKSHRGEPIKEQADYLVDEGRHEPDEWGVWTARTDRMVFKREGN